MPVPILISYSRLMLFPTLTSVAGPLTCRFRDILFFHNPYKMELSEKALFFCFFVSETYDTTLIRAKSVQIEKIRHSLGGFRHSFIEKG